MSNPTPVSIVTRIEEADTDLPTVELFLELLYTQQYPKEHHFCDSPNGCAFGDRFMAPGLRVSSENASIDTMVENTIHCPPYYRSIIYAYEHLPFSSAIFQALIDRHCSSFKKEPDTDKYGEIRHEEGS